MHAHAISAAVGPKRRCRFGLFFAPTCLHVDY